MKKYKAFKKPYPIGEQSPRRKSQARGKLDRTIVRVEEYGEKALGNLKIDIDIKKNILTVKNIFKGCYDLALREFTIGRGRTVKCFLFYIEGMADSLDISQNTLKTLMQSPDIVAEDDGTDNQKLVGLVRNTCISDSEIADVHRFNEAAKRSLNGCCILLPGWFLEKGIE